MESNFERWTRPEDLVPPVDCTRHPGVVRSALMACNHPMNGREYVWIEHACPRCAFEDEAGVFFSVLAAWDGSTWVESDADALFRRAWLEQARHEGLVQEDLPADVLEDPQVDTLVWAFHVLNPGLSARQCELLIARAWAMADSSRVRLLPLPYADAQALRRLSKRHVTTWIRYHEALVSSLSPDDLEIARSAGLVALSDWGEMRELLVPEEREIPMLDRDVYAGYTARLVAAHSHVVSELGIKPPTENDRCLVWGDAYGDLGLDIALGLNAWLNGEPAWLDLDR